MLIHLDSRTVATEVGIRQEVCNNIPAEWIGPENGWRSSIQHRYLVNNDEWMQLAESVGSKRDIVK